MVYWGTKKWLFAIYKALGTPLDSPLWCQQWPWSRKCPENKQNVYYNHTFMLTSSLRHGLAVGLWHDIIAKSCFPGTFSKMFTDLNFFLSVCLNIVSTEGKR